MSFSINEETVAQLVTIAKQAGDVIMKIYATDFTVYEKDDQSPVTEADQQAEALIIEAINKEVTDTFPIVGEESYDAGNQPDLSGGTFWLLDPLDGTKQFVNKRDEFTVNIALIENGTPVLGVIHAPAIGETFWGSPLGAFTEKNGEIRAMNCRAKPPSGGIAALVSRSHRTPEVDQYLEPFDVAEAVSSGSSLKFCRIADGTADLYPRMGRTMEWDTGAGHAILLAAGGHVVKTDNTPLTYAKSAVFDNPFFVAFTDDMTDAVRDACAAYTGPARAD